MAKKRIITSIEKVSQEVRDLITETYPLGWKNNVLRINKPNGEFFHAITLETDEISYLIKVAVKVDSKADLEKEEEKGYAGSSDNGDDGAEESDDEVADDSSSSDEE
ncbi:MAG: hypothetical protein KDC05_17330 [Bacteroidales bacterium]|nr:hypothetical protein [Bacteroidales bacterium]